MTGDEREAQAKKRFFMLNIARLSGAITATIGLAIGAGRLFPDSPLLLGHLLLILGLAEFFLLPVLLKKGWQKADGGQG